ncbi:hypothetical protein BJ138DRAFT_1108809 [Hygrophoropsis aurantiaca]|uniref:Uncharacterized protein n=1 Tax=Hygrophoropsis aurantiaca TaxID=72124 RepID=A0ACB8ATC4_9AGAM|nr:hypothetical protein BJ138DRAFT_1108809 [Hygrophoropsis aurantiaca]
MSSTEITTATYIPLSGDTASVASYSSTEAPVSSGIKLGGSIPASASSASSSSASQSRGASASTTASVSSFPGDNQSITSSAGSAAATSSPATSDSAASSAPAGQGLSSSPPQDLNSPGVTSTVTEQVQSTFSQAVSVTITNASGQVSVTVPPLVTSVGTSTQSNGAVVTYTQVIANPPSYNSGQNATSNSFFNNHGAVAGTFVAVGIIAAALFGCFYVVLARRRRQRQRDQLRSSITWPVNDARGGLFDQQLPMTPAYTDGASFPSPVRWRIPSSQPEPVPQPAFDGGVAGVGTLIPELNDHEGPFSDYHSINRNSRGPIGLAVTTGPASRHNSGVPSVALSSPSLYPPSLLPATEEKREDDLARNISPLRSPTSSPPPRPRRLRPPMSTDDLRIMSSAFSDDSSTASALPSVIFRSPSAPPRPPRSRPDVVDVEPQRRLSKLTHQYRPVTPPTSVSSQQDSTGEPSTPILEGGAAINSEATQLQRGASLLPRRRTLLDVRTVPRQS